MQKELNEEPRPPLSVKLICGAVAGVIGTCIIFPLDIIKTRLQNQKPNANGKLPYSGLLDAGRKMVSREGIRGLYNGLYPNLVGIIPEKAIKLAVNDYSREYWGKVLDRHPDRLPLVYGMMAGATAGVCQVVATNPMEMVKIQLQLAGTSAAKDRLTAGEICKKLGVRGLYKGTMATLARDVPFSIVFFSLVSLFKEYGTTEGEKTPLYTVFASGIGAGALAAAAVTPMDMVKTRMQVIPKPGDLIYSSQIHCYKHAISKEGFKCLFKGVVPRVLIVSPLFAITVLVYEFQQRAFSCRDQK